MSAAAVISDYIRSMMPRRAQMFAQRRLIIRPDTHSTQLDMTDLGPQSTQAPAGSGGGVSCLRTVGASEGGASRPGREAHHPLDEGEDHPLDVVGRAEAVLRDVPLRTRSSSQQAVREGLNRQTPDLE